MKGDIKTGTWSDDGKTFSNDWSNISFKLPNGYRALSDEEIKTATGAGADIIAESGDQSKASIDAAMMKVAYDFYILKDDATGIPQVYLVYENLALTPQIKDEATYFEASQEALKAYEAMGITYEVLPTETVTIADEEYLACTISLNSGVGYQTQYLRKADSVMVNLVATYNSESEAELNDLLANVKSLK
jgi:hypothetical protein